MERDKLIKYCREYIGVCLDYVKTVEQELEKVNDGLQAANEYTLTQIYNMLYSMTLSARKLQIAAENTRKEKTECEEYSTKSDVGL